MQIAPTSIPMVTPEYFQHLRARLEELDVALEQEATQDWPSLDTCWNVRVLGAEVARAGASMLAAREAPEFHAAAELLLVEAESISWGIGFAAAMRAANQPFGDQVGYDILLDGAIQAARDAELLLTTSPRSTS